MARKSQKPQKSPTKVNGSEAELVSRAQSAVSTCNWVVGECAALWTRKYAKGRTDADFAAMVGLSPDQVYQRRRVWETFGDVHPDYAALKWSHFYVALKWDDAPQCLAWAEENEATVAEMKAWRRANRGEDLTTEPEPDDWSGDPAVTFVPREATPVRDPREFGPAGGGGRSAVTTGATSEGWAAAETESPETLARVAREAEGSPGEYAPFRQGAGSPAPQEGGGATAVAEKPQPTPAQLLGRIIGTIERLNSRLTPELMAELRRGPQKTRDRLVKAVAELSAKTAELI